MILGSLLDRLLVLIALEADGVRRLMALNLYPAAPDNNVSGFVTVVSPTTISLTFRSRF